MIKESKTSEYIKYISYSEHVQFISYTGRYPHLCSGRLTLEIDGVKYRFGRDHRNSQVGEYCSFWFSGGGLDSLYEAYEGEWVIDEAKLPEELRKYAAEIDRVFNANVEHGCCGGCT